MSDSNPVAFVVLPALFAMFLSFSRTNAGSVCTIPNTHFAQLFAHALLFFARGAGKKIYTAKSPRHVSKQRRSMRDVISSKSAEETGKCHGKTGCGRREDDATPLGEWGETQLEEKMSDVEELSVKSYGERNLVRYKYVPVVGVALAVVGEVGQSDGRGRGSLTNGNRQFPPRLLHCLYNRMHFGHCIYRYAASAHRLENSTVSPNSSLV